jgi:type IV pilus assembly protein PilW
MKTQFRHRTPVVPAQGGFTLVELMVTVGIALFLLGGLVMIMQNVRQANITQSQLTTLQDEQRFALVVLTDAIQMGGYVANPLGDSTAQFPAVGLFPQGAAFTGSHSPSGVVLPTVANDTIQIRYHTTPENPAVASGGPILCNGVDSSKEAVATDYTIVFSLNTANDTLQCTVNGGQPVTLVNGVHAMEIYYGINRLAPGADYNIDTYVTWDGLVPPSDFLTISAIRVLLSFDNPMYVAGGSQPQFITIERVIQVMARAGVVI